MITDKLGSYAAARRQVMPAIEHRSHKGLNNRAENSHLPLRRRERVMQGFRSREDCSGSSAFSPPSAIFSGPAAKPSPLICNVWTPWHTGKPWPASPSELEGTAEIALPRPPSLNVTTPQAILAITGFSSQAQRAAEAVKGHHQPDTDKAQQERRH